MVIIVSRKKTPDASGHMAAAPGGRR